MAFSMADYLQDYRKEDISREKELIKSKWKKTLDIIQEAFSDKYVNIVEAKRVIKNEFTKGECSNKIDQTFLKENLNYVLEKVENLNEGDIKIIINNAPKGKNATPEIEEIDEAKGKKGKKKSKKDEEEKEEPEDSEEEVIVDEPSTDEITVSTAEAPEQLEVTIAYNAEEKKLIVTEGEDIIEELEIEDDEALKQVVAFLKEFYSKHDYQINEEGLEEIGETETTEGLPEEGQEDEESFEDLAIDEPMEESKNLTEARRFGFMDLLEMEETSENIEEEIEKPKCSDLVGKAVESKGNWFTVQSCDDSNMLTVLDKDGQNSVIDINDVTDWEKDVIKTESVKCTCKTLEEGKKCSVCKCALNKKKDVKSQSLSKNPMKKTGQVITKVKVPKITKKGESTGSFTKKSGMKTMSKVPSISKVSTPKKDIKGQALTAKTQTSTGQKIPSVIVPKMTKKDVSGSGYTKTPKKPDVKKETVKAPKL